MKIQTTTTHEVTFTIESFWHEEGGMGHDQSGGDYNDLPQALRALELVHGQSKHPEWVIVCRSKITTK